VLVVLATSFALKSAAYRAAVYRDGLNTSEL
jgi:hypothetical protein